MCNFQRLRSIPDCVKWLKQQDPETRITAAMIRELAASGEVKCVWRGRKALIDIDSLPEAITAWVDKNSQIPRDDAKVKSDGIKTVSGRYGKVRAI